MHHLLRLCIVAGFIVLASASDASAQGFLKPFHIAEGYNTALAKARDTLASDAYLVYSGTFGNLDLFPFGIPAILNFYQDSETPQGLAVEPGQADAWGYVFFSPSLQRTVNLVVVNAPFIGGFLASGVDIDLPLPSRLTDLLDLRVNGTGGDSLMARVKRNTVYSDYHARYPEYQPTVVSLGIVLPDEIIPPSEFVANGPSWTMTFDGGGDTSGMVCIVSSGTGQAICQLAAATSVAIDVIASSAMHAFPNPSTGTLRITIGDPSRLRGDVALELFDASGALVADLGANLASNELQYADVDVTTLVAGAYFCRLTVDGRTQVIPLRIIAQ